MARTPAVTSELPSARQAEHPSEAELLPTEPKVAAHE